MFPLRRLTALSLVAGVAVVAAVRTGRAQQSVASAPGTYDPRLFQALEWRSIGPNRGGRSLTAAGSASRPLEYYFGATGGGVWKTTDGGVTWRPVSDLHFHSSSVGALAVCAANPDVVYAGMGESQLR